MAFPTSGIAGVNLTATYVSAGVAPFSLGRTVKLSDGGEAIFVCSSLSGVSTFNCVVIAKNFKVSNVTTGIAHSSGGAVGFAQTSIGTGYCGWVQTGGRPIANLAANCAPFVTLYTTGTAGVLDDATVSGSGGMVMGIVANTSISNATAATLIVAGHPWVQSMVGS